LTQRIRFMSEEDWRHASMIPFLSVGLSIFKLIVVCERRTLASATFFGSLLRRVPKNGKWRFLNLRDLMLSSAFYA